MTSVQIKCFLEAAHSGSFTEAAEKLYMTQPTFGRQISSLEKELGFALFVRGWKSYRLTAQGELLRDGLTRLSGEFDALVEQAGRLTTGEGGVLRIGMLEGQLMDQRLYEWIQAFRKKYPGAEVTNLRYSFHDLLEAVRTDRIDLAVTLQLDVQSRPEFHWQHLYALHNELVIPKQLMPEKRDGLTLRDFAEQTFVEVETGESDVISELMQKSCQEAGFTPKFLRVPDLRAQMAAVEFGSGVAAFNQYHQACNHPGLAHCPLPELPDVDFCLAWNRDTGNPAVKLFLDMA
jgi:DNA-binding transcriptional LysR family regulator